MIDIPTQPSPSTVITSPPLSARQVPEDGPDEEAREQVRSSSHSRRHTKDVDMLEHFSVPRGGRLADGIKLGDGLR